MHWIDLSIVVVYFAAMLFIGFWFHWKNNNTEDYFVGSRKMTKWHLGLSVVATDVGASPTKCRPSPKFSNTVTEKPLPWPRHLFLPSVTWAFSFTKSPHATQPSPP